MYFTKEIIESTGLLYSNDSPPLNDLDFSCICQGLVTKDLFRGMLEHYARLGMLIYAIYIPDKRKYDVYRWMPINIMGNAVIYNISNSKENIFPKIVYCEELEGEECGKIWCYAIGVKNIEELRNRNVLSFNEAKEIFGEDGVNWCHVKIG